MKLKILQKPLNTLKMAGFGPNSGLLGQKMTQKSSFFNLDETFRFYSIFYVEYEYETQNPSKPQNPKTPKPQY